MSFSKVGCMLVACVALSVLTQTLAHDDFVYMDNGVIRAGIDLVRGGSIGFLGPSGSKDNVINCHDMGRELKPFEGVVSPFN